ncbi:uncharacterized protein LOC110981647 [Acanthaster planci]|uniref:Uncharacterized protein LOC110981647 n=1 Tax=Acanthaster planci TaxID=133434 RepID=A0A8B7YP76_ACAPL|nr:uncharacterized protein LOC110981647 [Acanthaster planci]
MAGVFLDETLHHLGKYGRYQVTCALLIMTIGNWFPAWHLMGIIFTADSPDDYRCATDLEGPGENVNSSISKNGAWGSTELPYKPWSGSQVHTPRNASDDKCFVYGTDEPCTDWQYRTQYGETTLVTDLDLVCDRSLLSETAQSVYLVGMLVGSVLLGFLSDTFGRKIVLLLACVAHGVWGVIAVFVWNYPAFVTLWFLIGLFSQGYNQVQFVIIMEMFPPECRTLMGSLNNMFWGLGVITLTPIAYLLKNWRHMQLAISIPCFMAIPLWFVLDDSVRWLVAKGRLDEAFQILNKMARWNRTAPPPGGFVLSQEADEQVVLDKEKNGETSEMTSQRDEAEEKKLCTYLDILKSWKLLLNTAIIYFCWFVSMMTYYGASLNSAHLAGNKYANFFFLGLAEIPAFFIIHFTMTWWGRRPSMGLFFLLSGLASITTAFLPKQTEDGADLTAAIVVMAILAKLCITCAFSINLIFCSEVFPTPVRNIGFGIGAVVANLGTVIAPFVLYLGDFASFIPLTIFGGMSITASLLVPILPETKDKPLPETIKDAKNLGRGRHLRRTHVPDQGDKKGDYRQTDFSEEEEAVKSATQSLRVNMAASRLDDVLQYIGKYGRYQMIMSVVITILGTWLPAWHMMGLIFLADRPQSRHCLRWSTNLGALIAGRNGKSAGDVDYSDWMKQNNHSLERSNVTDFGGDDKPSNISDFECTTDADAFAAVSKSCMEWEYHTLYNESTIVTDFDLVCNRKILAETAQSIFLVGMLVGSVVFGYISDVFGRKIVLLGACLANGVFGIVVSFVWTYPGVVILWFLVGLFSQGYNQVQFVMIMEMFPAPCRTLAGSLNALFWGLGSAALAPIAYALRQWRHLQLAISVPCLLAAPLWLILDESVRWLLSNDRLGDAQRTVEKMARWNGVAPPFGGFVLINDIEEVSPLGEGNSDKIDQMIPQLSQKKCTICDVFKNRRVMLNVCIVFFFWFVSLLTYYGGSLNSSHIAGNKYANFLFLALSEIPGYIIIHFTMNRWGRRKSLGLFFLLSGVASITTACLPNRTVDGTDLSTVIIVAAMLVKLFIVCAYSINIICCTEILPTSVRNIGFGVGAVCGSVGLTVAPFIIYLDEFVSFLPLSIFGVLCVISAMLVPILPETRNKPLPESIEDAENIGKKLPKTTDIHGEYVLTETVNGPIEDDAM